MTSSELPIAKVARSAGFIKLSAIGQGPDQAKLISFSVDEENAGWFSGGYFGVILRSVTLDGWVVIGLLGIMALISWYVMVDRISYLNRVSAGNTIFLKHFRETSTDIGGLLQLDSQENDPELRGRARQEAAQGGPCRAALPPVRGRCAGDPAPLCGRRLPPAVAAGDPVDPRRARQRLRAGRASASIA